MHLFFNQKALEPLEFCYIERVRLLTMKWAVFMSTH